MNNEKFRLFACAASGIFSCLPFFVPSLYILEWISSVPFFYVLLCPAEYSARKAFRYGFVQRLCLSAAVLSWFSELLSMSAVDYPKPLMIAVVLAAVFLISALQSLLFGFSAVLIRKIAAKPRFLPTDLILSALIPTVAELILSLGRFGFPWVVLYLTQRNFLIGIQTASLFGGHFISFLIYLVNLLLAKSLLYKVRLPDRNRRCVYAVVAALAVFSGNVLTGSVLYSEPNGKDGISVAVYQDNHSSYEKWDGNPLSVCDEFVNAFEATYTEETAPDIILLSETVFTTTLGRDYTSPNEIGAQIEKKLCALTEQYKTAVVCGAFYKADEQRFNAQFAFENGNRLPDVYCKRTLVPFGEYMPYETTLNKLFPFLAEMNLSGSSLSPGTDAAVFHLQCGDFGGLICYDSIFYQNARKSAKNKADYLLLSTNDSWYNDSAAIDQHFGHAIFRAVENRKSILRCATTGCSGLIDAYGNTLKRSKLFTRVILDSNLDTSDGMSLFTRFGYTYIPIAAVICLLLRFSIKKKEKAEENA